MQLVVASRRLSGAWFSAPKNMLIEILDEFDARLAHCLGLAGVQHRLPEHEQLDAWARRYGGRSRSTGAGGGDMALLIGDMPLENLGVDLIRLDLGL